MLHRLLIRNYALIAEEEMRLSAGFSVLTGETGAGKTLLVGALGLVLGRRADHSLLFSPDKKCVVEAEFTALPPRTVKELKRLETFDQEGDVVILRREISPGGSSRAFVNDTPVSLQVMREVAERLVDLHGQHENQLLLSPEQQLAVLDQFAGCAAEADAFGAQVSALRQAEQELEALNAQEAEARRQLDYLLFQLKELKAARLDPDAEEAVEKEVKLLENATGIREGLGHALNELYEDEQALYNRLASLIQRLEKLNGVSDRIATQTARLREANSILKEAAFELQDLADGVNTDPGRLEELFELQNAWNKLKLKFSVRSLAELVALQTEFQQKADEFGSLDQRIAELEKHCKMLRALLARSGAELEEKRQKAAPALAKKVLSLLKEVGLEQADFAIALTQVEGTGPGTVEVEGKRVRAFSTGLNKAEFRIRTNKGSALGPLSSVASGGEVSRVMLALKAALAARAELGVMVFDEIDTGISGEVARKVARVMESLAEKVQVIAITHLPQIAGRGAHHYRVVKETEGRSTVTRVQKITRPERVIEIARMLSGDPPGKSALKNAEELLSSN